MIVSARVSVGRPAGEAFWSFVRELGEWWPIREGYSFGGAELVDLVMEEREGGRFYERWRDGTEHEIGRIVAFEPPTRLAFTWKDPDWSGPTEVEIRFEADGDRTAVTVEHRDFDRAEAKEEAAGYAAGWQLILERFVGRMTGGT